MLLDTLLLSDSAPGSLVLGSLVLGSLVLGSLVLGSTDPAAPEVQKDP